MSSLVKGKVYKHPDDKGAYIYITGGYYTDPIYRRISNHFNWRIINSDGSLGKEEYGYGWSAEPVDVDINIKVKKK